MEEIFLRFILQEDYEEFVKKNVEYFKEDEECMINDIPDIIKAMSIATILIGFTKKPVNLNEYKVKLKKKNIKVNTKDFINVFKKYIDKVEDAKLDMLKDIT